MKYLVCFGLLFFVFACQKSEKEVAQSVSKSAEKNIAKNINSQPFFDKQEPEKQKSSINSISFQTIDWLELIPKEDLDILLNPPEYITNIEDGSSADQVLSNISNMQQASNADEDRYQQALISTDIVKAMNNKNIRIPGFVVPVGFDEQQKVTSFFLVPYFGACLHMPPPPPNQVIYVQVESGFVLGSLYDPVWVTGKLTTELFEDPLATSAYLMQMQQIEPYENEKEQ